MFDIIRRWKKGSTSVEDSLKHYYGISESIIAFGFFGVIFNEKLDIKSYFHGNAFNAEILLNENLHDRLLVFLSDKWAEALFAMFVMGWFFLYRTAVKNEMAVLVKLYSRINPPHDWERTIGSRMVPLLSIGLTIAFLGLAATIDHLEFFCMIMLFLNVQDAYGNNILRKNLIRHFKDPKYAPHPSDLHAPFILARREVAVEYWVDRPQIERIGLMMMGVVAAFMLTTNKHYINIDGWEHFVNPTTEKLPYFILILVIACNEVTMTMWRNRRDDRLDEIEAKQKKHELEMHTGSKATAENQDEPTLCLNYEI